MRYSSSDYSDVVLKSSLISRISPESFRSLYCFIRHRIWKFSFDLCTNPRCFERARICQRVFPSYETPSYSGSHNKHNFECTLHSALGEGIKLRTCFFIFMPHVFSFLLYVPRAHSLSTGDGNRRNNKFENSEELNGFPILGTRIVLVVVAYFASFFIYLSLCGKWALTR